MGTISDAVNTVKNTVTPVVSLARKHWKMLLIGGLIIYALVISIAFFSFTRAADNASAQSKLDAAAAKTTIDRLTTNLAATKASLAESKATVGRQQQLIEQSSEDFKRLQANNRQLDEQNKRLIANQSAASGSNTEAIGLNGRAIKIVNDLIKASR